MKKWLIGIFAMLAFQACSSSDMLAPSFDKDSSSGESGFFLSDGPSGESGGEPGSAGSGNGSAQGQAGRLTAGEWKDLDNWSFWGKLMNGQEEPSQMPGYWGFNTENRVAVCVKDVKGNPVAGARVALLREKLTLWNAVTDNKGRADLFPALFKGEKGIDGPFSVSVNGVVQKGEPALTGFNAEEGPAMNEYIIGAEAASAVADIAFIVDATGSMGDEIDFLKQDMLDILNKAASAQAGVKFRTAALFYRDEGDRYVTKPSNFSEDFSVTHTFIGDQEAAGGGDYPEAVHTALEKGLQNLSWSESARTRIAFLVLDAPAHYRTEVVESLHASIEAYARMGIRIIPVAASGVDKNTEFMCRFFAIATGGTYVFLTNHSGIGNSHIAPTIGDYKVELLNDLILRLIKEYTE